MSTDCPGRSYYILQSSWDCSCPLGEFVTNGDTVDLGQGTQVFESSVLRVKGKGVGVGFTTVTLFISVTRRNGRI